MSANENSLRLTRISDDQFGGVCGENEKQARHEVKRNFVDLSGHTVTSEKYRRVLAVPFAFKSLEFDSNSHYTTKTVAHLTDKK